MTNNTPSKDKVREDIQKKMQHARGVARAQLSQMKNKALQMEKGTKS